VSCFSWNSGEIGPKAEGLRVTYRYREIYISGLPTSLHTMLADRVGRGRSVKLKKLSGVDDDKLLKGADGCCRLLPDEAEL